MRGFQSLEEAREAHLKEKQWIRTHLASKERIEKTLSKLPNLTIRLKKTSKSDLQMLLNSNKCIHLEDLPARAPTCWKRNSTKSSSTTGKDWSTRTRRNSRCLLKYFHHLWSPRTKSKLKTTRIMRIPFWSKRRTYRSKEGRAMICLQRLSSLKSQKKARPSQQIEAGYQASAIRNSLVMSSQKWPFCWVQMHDTWRIDRRYKVTTRLMIEMIHLFILVLSQGLIALNEWWRAICEGMLLSFKVAHRTTILMISSGRNPMKKRCTLRISLPLLRRMLLLRGSSLRQIGKTWHRSRQRLLSLRRKLAMPRSSTVRIARKRRPYTSRSWTS